VRRLGVITSPRGAAVRDVLTCWPRAFPLLEVEVLPVPCRAAPPAEIRAMLERACASERYDALLITRGGGSLEDLWCFNDESLARAIAASPIPIVSAVGHEIDFTLADFAADLRAPTPSAAAEMLVPDQAELSGALRQLRTRLDAALLRQQRALAQRADQAALRLHALRPQMRLERGAHRLALLHSGCTRPWPVGCVHARNSCANRCGRSSDCIRGNAWPCRRIAPTCCTSAPSPWPAARSIARQCACAASAARWSL
jgi:exodeoxyribonuclease VII large subunit